MKTRQIPTQCICTVLNMAKNRIHAAKILQISSNALFNFTKEPCEKPNYAHTTSPMIAINNEELIELTDNWPMKYKEKDTVNNLHGRFNWFFRY